VNLIHSKLVFKKKKNYCSLLKNEQCRRRKAADSPQKVAPACFVLPCVTNADFNGPYEQ